MNVDMSLKILDDSKNCNSASTFCVFCSRQTVFLHSTKARLNRTQRTSGTKCCPVYRKQKVNKYIFIWRLRRKQRFSIDPLLSPSIQTTFYSRTVFEIRKAIKQSAHHPPPSAAAAALILNSAFCWCVFINSSVAVLVTDRDVLIHRCTVDFRMHPQRTHIELELLCGLHHIFINDSLNPFDIRPPPRFSTAANGSSIEGSSHYCSLWLMPGKQVIQ